MRTFAYRKPLALLLGHVLLALAAPVLAAQPPAQPSARAELSIDPASVMQPWKGDLDGMLKRGYIRVLTVYSKTFYFQDQGTQRGTAYDAFRVFEDDLNKRLEKEGKLKQKHLRVRVVFVPVGRSDLLQALASGK